MTRLLLALLAFYRRWLSPAMHSLGTGGCRYLPTCSEYATIAIATHGPLRGTAWLSGGCCAAIPSPAADLDPRSSFYASQARPFPHQPLP